MAQFRATAGEDFINPTTGQTVNFTQEQLDADEALGFLSEQFVPLSEAPTEAPEPEKLLNFNPESTGFVVPPEVFAARQQLANQTPAVVEPAVTPVTTSPTVEPGQEAGGEVTAAAGPGAGLPPSGSNLLQIVNETNPELFANRDFINGAFQAFAGRNATAAELNRFAGKKVGSAREAISALGRSGAGFKTGPAAGEDGTFDGETLGGGGLLFPELEEFTDVDSFVKSAIQLEEKMFEAAELPEAVRLREKREKLLTELEVDTTKLVDESKRKEELLKEQGVLENESKIQELRLQIAQKVGEYLQGEENIGNQLVAARTRRGRLGALMRQKAVDIGILQSEEAARMQNIELAEQIVDRTIELEFGPIRQEIENLSNFLDVNAALLTEAETKEANRLKGIVTQRTNLLNIQIAEKQSNMDLRSALAKEGLDVNGVDMNKSFAENLSAASGVIRTEILRREAREERLIGVRASASGGGKKTSEETLVEFQDRLNASRGEDGHVNTALYKAIEQEFVLKGGTREGFRAVFTPADNLNPEDASADEFRADPDDPDFSETDLDFLADQFNKTGEIPIQTDDVKLVRDLTARAEQRKFVSGAQEAGINTVDEAEALIRQRMAGGAQRGPGGTTINEPVAGAGQAVRELNAAGVDPGLTRQALTNITNEKDPLIKRAAREILESNLLEPGVTGFPRVSSEPVFSFFSNLFSDF